LVNTTGSNNTANGMNSLSSNVIGSNNTALGFESGLSNTADDNTFIGYQAGYSNTTGLNNVFLGYQAGYNELGSNKLYIANSATNPPLIYGDFSTGRVGIGTVAPTSTLQVVGLAEYTDNATAIAAGLTAGAFYRTGDVVKVVH